MGDVTEPENSPHEEEMEDVYFPQPVWGSRTSGDRLPESDEVEAWKVLLAGGRAIWLDDGDRIRSLDPRLPQGDRVNYASLSDVVPGAYLVLREGESERGAMYNLALRGLGTRAAGVSATQARWKQALKQRLEGIGAPRAIEELRAQGVKSAGQVRSWVDPRLVCPQRDTDLALVLDWLGERREPTHGNAVTLRRAVFKASADLRRELEAAVALADLKGLEQTGVLHLEMARDGSRGIFVARVLARSPFTEIVPRSQTRVPFPDRGGQWLE